MASLNHVGLTVADLDAAVRFYETIFDLEVLVGPHLATLEMEAGERRRDVFGPNWRAMRLAHLATRDGGVGIELFEFLEPATVAPATAFEYWRRGVSHICFTVEALERTIDKIIALGGRQRSQIHQVRPETRICYCEDPWGVVIELSSGDYHQIVGARKKASP